MNTVDQIREMSRNVWWSWNPEALELFRQLNPGAFDAAGNNPVVALRFADEHVLDDPGFAARVDGVYQSFRRYMDTPGSHAERPPVAYFCMEFGLHESMPFYAGGLGILAGDHVKAASDLGLPLTAVGLFLRDGYFRQYFDHRGNQQEDYPAPGVTSLPIEAVPGADGAPLTIPVYVGRRVVYVRAWRMHVGKCDLILLDTDFLANPPEFRILTRRLYSGNRSTRLQQEIILGIGGMRILQEMGTPADVYHMNEGHCALLTLELLRRRRDLLPGDDLDLHMEAVRDMCVFTTHTPVMAGHDRFESHLFLELMSTFREESGLSEYDLLALGRQNPEDPSEEFTMTILGLKMSRSANGVSRLNGEVARRQWTHLYPDRAVRDIPISHITNGVHLPSWAAPHARAFLSRHFGDWESNRQHQATWDRIQHVSDPDIWAYRQMLRAHLVNWVHDRVAHQTLPMDAALDPHALTIGFARRFATYKRAPLLFADLQRAAALFAREGQPLQILFAGKAHPQDTEGKAFIRDIVELARDARFNGRLVFLEDYDMQVGRMLVSGCDVWLNTPRRPYEASGTSGQKVAIHGGLNLSIPDGWWPEGANGNNGWSIGTDASHEYHDPALQDVEDAGLLLELLEEQVIPTFYTRDQDGPPAGWIRMVRNAMRTLTYPFSAHRMVTDYADTIYSSPSLFANDLNSSTSWSNESSANRIG